MNPLTLARIATTLAPLVLATLTAALTVKAAYDPSRDELTITIRKIRPAATALAIARGRLA